MADRLKRYTGLPLLTIDGENTVEDGYWAYNLNEDSLEQTILQLFYEEMNDTFVTPDDVTRYLGIQPLATIPEADLGDFNQRSRKRGLKRREKAK